MDSDNPRPNEKGKSGRLPFRLIEWETRVKTAIGMGKISVSPETIKQLINPKKFGDAPDIPEFEHDEFLIKLNKHFVWPLYVTGGKLKTELPRPWSGVPQDFKGIKGLDQDAVALLKRMRDAIPYKHNKEKKPIMLSPLVLYYLTRYLGPWLAGTKDNDRDGTPTWSDAVWDNLQFHPERKKFEKKDKEDRIRGYLDPESIYASDMRINDLFPFDKIRTTYTDENNIEADVKYGLLQKYYSTLNSGARKSFVDNVWDKLIENLPEVKSPLPGEPKRIDDEYATHIAAFVQETDSATSSTKKLKMFDDPYEESLVSIYTGAILEIPGLNLILAENPFNHNFFEGSLPENIEYDIDLSSIDDLRGSEYLFNLINLLYEHANANDTDDLIIHLRDILDETEEYSITMQREGKNVNAIVMSMDENNIFTTQINLSTTPVSSRGSQLLRAKKTNPITTASPIKDEAGSSRVHEGFDRALVGLITYEEAFDVVYKFLKNTGMDQDIAFYVRDFFFDPEEPVTIDSFLLGNPNYSTEDITGFMAIALTSGLPEAQEEPGEAKMFCALGAVVETLMVKHAVEASKGAKKAPVSNIYDEMMAALLGNSRNPGLATYHALIHYNMLGAQLRTPLLKWKETSEKELLAGRLIAAEAWLDDPAKLLNMWMMNYRNYIDFGGWDDATGSPIFFRVPLEPFEATQKNTGMLNAFARLAIAYYRMTFKMLSTRPVFIQPVKAGTEEASGGKRQSGTRYAEIKKYWASIIRDSVNDPPKPGMFAMVLRFFADTVQSTGREAAGQALITPYPTWMPAPPESFDQAQTYKDKKMVTKFLKWSYGNKPMDIDNFCEIAAAYHAAKCLSAADKYEDMVRMFLDAVSDDLGHPFLYACLMNPKAQANEAKVGRPPIDVNITNLQDMVIQGLTPEMKQQMEELLETPEYDPSAENKTWVDEVEEYPEDWEFAPEDEEFEVEEEETVVEKVETELDAQVEEEGFEQKQSREVADSIDPITQEDPWLSFQRELRDYVDGLFERGGINDNQLKAFQRDKQFRRRLQEMRESGEEPPSAQEAFEEWRETQR